MIDNNLEDFMMVLNQEAIIESVFPSDSVMANQIGKKAQSIFVSHDDQLFISFINQLNNRPILFFESIHIQYHDQQYLCQINGFKDETNTYIFVFFSIQSDVEVLRKMMILNSHQVNQLRSLQKTLQLQDVKIYEEISKLNSELLNSKRVIEKQNSELQRYNSLLKKMSIEDVLTGSYNRRFFYDYVKENYLTSVKDQTHSMIFIDFNHFKSVNDQLGHDVGDRLLIGFVKISKDIIKNQGVIFRFGGDEFIILLHCMEYEEALNIMKHIALAFKDLSTIATLAYGIVVFNEMDLNFDFDISSLVKNADKLMYRHKVKNRKSP